MNGFIPGDENDNNDVQPVRMLEQRVKSLEKENEGLKKTLKATCNQVEKLLSHSNDASTTVNHAANGKNETGFTCYERGDVADNDETSFFDGVHTVGKMRPTISESIPENVK